MQKIIVLTLLSVALSIVATLLIARLATLRSADPFDEGLGQAIPEADLADILEGGS